MKRLVPHWVVFGATVAVLTYGIIANVGIIGGYAGAVLATMVDPIQTGFAIMFGIVLTKQRYLIPALILLGLGMAVFIAHINSDLGAQLTGRMVAIKVLAAILIGFAVNAVAIATRSRRSKAL